MRYYISSDSGISVLEEIWAYCQSHGIGMYHGRILAELGYFGWYIEIERDPRITWILLKFSEHLTIYEELQRGH